MSRWPNVPCEGESIAPERFCGPDYRIDHGTGCWNWLKATVAQRAGHPSGAPHRKYYEAAFGPIPAGHDVHHGCKNILCVNPAHLEAVPERVHDVVHFLHERCNITLEDVRAIRELGRKPGVSVWDVAQQYGITYRTVYNYWNGVAWPEICGDGPVVATAICVADDCDAPFIQKPRHKQYCSRACRERVKNERRRAA